MCVPLSLSLVSVCCCVGDQLSKGSSVFFVVGVVVVGVFSPRMILWFGFRIGCLTWMGYCEWLCEQSILSVCGYFCFSLPVARSALDPLCAQGEFCAGHAMSVIRHLAIDLGIRTSHVYRCV